MDGIGSDIDGNAGFGGGGGVTLIGNVCTVSFEVTFISSIVFGTTGCVALLSEIVLDATGKTCCPKVAMDGDYFTPDINIQKNH